MLLYLVIGAVLFGATAMAVRQFLTSRVQAGLAVGALFFVLGLFTFGLGYAVLMAIWGYVIGRMTLWLHTGDYRLNLPPYATSREVLWFYTFRSICGAIFVFLITPIIILIPLSFNQQPYFSLPASAPASRR